MGIDRRVLDHLRASIELERELMIVWAMRRISETIGDKGASSSEAEPQNPWIAIDSLSRLRAVVGGRFHNLKERWVGANLPTKVEKGADTLDLATSVDEAGWQTLAAWILKQGFEARLVTGRAECLFEVRKIR